MSPGESIAALGCRLDFIKGKFGMRRNVLICILTSLLVGCNTFNGPVFRTTTNDMSPTIKEGDTVFSDPTYYKHSPVARGDIVVVGDPDEKKNPDGRVQMYIKRVIGLGGDKVQIVSGKVYVNDQILGGAFGTGKYFSDNPVKDFGPVIVRQSEYFLVGDNLANSADSRHWKRSTVKIEDIQGKVTQIKERDTGNTRSL